MMYLQCFSSDTQRRYRTEDIRLVSSNESAVPRLCMFCEIYLKCNINANLCCICGVSTLSMILVTITRETSLVNGKMFTIDYIQMQHK